MHKHIIAQARTWLGTNFQHQGRIKATNEHRGGCDCIGLIIGVASELGLESKCGAAIVNCDCDDYPPLPESGILELRLGQYLIEVGNNISLAQTGDVGLFSFAKNPQHVGLLNLTEAGDSIIHAYSVVGKVCEHRLDGKWRSRLVNIYRFLC